VTTEILPATTETLPATTLITTTANPAAAAAAGAAVVTANQEEPTSSTPWGWIAFGILATAVAVGGLVWWLKRRHDKGPPAAPGGDPSAPESAA
jgi:tellurite resistance protein TehA-like permease